MTTLLLCGLHLMPFALAQQALGTNNYRSNGGPLTGGSTAYNYVPSIIQDGNYKMYWCSQTNGDHGDNILYAEASSINGPWGYGSQPFLDIFGGTGSSSNFDGLHTCDPSVVRAQGTTYLYYGGESQTGALTAIGVASSTDGIHFGRLNGGNAIISAAQQQSNGNSYGAGQPSALYKDGLFYISFTDTTGAGAGSNGAGQFLWKSSDPTFQSGVLVATAYGWADLTEDNSRAFSIINAVSVDMQYSDQLEALIIAHDNVAGETTLSFFDIEEPQQQEFNAPYQDVQIQGDWSEGPGIVSRPDKHSVVSTNSDCGTIPIDIIRSTIDSAPGTPNNLAHIGIDLLSGESCASMQGSQIASIYSGYGLESSGLPAALVVGGQRLQFQSAKVWQDFTRNFVGVTSDVFQSIPFGASLFSGATVLGATGLPAAFQLDNNVLWPVSCLQAIEDDGSHITTVSPQQWESYPVGPSLFCV